MQIVRLTELRDRPAALAAIDAIYFEASAIKTFADDAARAAFRQRWLGRYIDAWPGLVFLARDADGTVAGYLVGCLVDPARDSRFDDIAYFKAFVEPCALYPAHLHINLAPAYRGHGLGGRLIDAFGAAARDAGAPGMHIVTGKGARNTGFYRQQGFAVIAEMRWNENSVIFMGRRL